MNLLLQQSNRELRDIARVEHVPYSGLNKRSLVERIMHYRATAGTLYRKNRTELNAEARNIGFEGYSKMHKGELIDALIIHKNVVKPRLDRERNSLGYLTKVQLRELAKNEKLPVIGGKKRNIIDNIAKHRIVGEFNAKSKQVEWVKN